ncbi:MAG: YraN family protein [candidate division SR1 bacterium]|nr:YraN family protein [candidate division SR1 bacterium]
MSLKSKGYKGEKIALERYLQREYTLLDQNFTIPGGEIDLIFTKGETIIFVEVKVVDGISERDNYLSPKKIQSLERSIENYCYIKGIEKEIRLDLVFIQNSSIVEIYENISNN